MIRRLQTRRDAGRLPAAQAGVEHRAEVVAHEVDRYNGDEDQDAGSHPRVALNRSLVNVGRQLADRWRERMPPLT